MSDKDYYHEIARDLIRRYGKEAPAVAQRRARAHRIVGEPEGEELWCSIAGTVRAILLGHQPPSVANYRIYFRYSGGICGRDDFLAEDDDAAITVAEILADACSDACNGFELWQEARKVSESHRPRSGPRIALAELTAKMQASVVEREEAILQSNWAVSRSRRLLDRLAVYNQCRPGGSATPGSV